LGPHALDGAQDGEGAPLVAGQKTIQARAVLLAPLGLHMKDHVVAGRRQPLQGARAADSHVAGARTVDQALGLACLDQGSPKTTDHAASVLTRRRWAWVMATARASAASAFTSPAVGS